jgi:hypothetical protein
LITITRAVIRNVRTAFRKAGIHKVKSDRNPPVALVASRNGLSVRAMSHVAALEYYEHQPAEPETIWVPPMFLDDCEGSKAEPVTVELLADGRVTAQFRDKNIPQLLQYDAVPDNEKPGGFPSCPDKLARNEADLLPALLAAAETTDDGSARYALSNMQINGSTGIIEATNGRHFLRQTGFSFPWKDNVLVSASKFFAFAGLPDNQAVEVGKSGNWAVFRIGPWTIWLPIDTVGRYPKTADLVPSVDAAKSSCRLSASDADFLLRSVGDLPDEPDGEHCLTVDLNGHVAVRAQARDQSEPTELILTNSTASGEPLRTAVNRRFLTRGVRLGLRKFYFYGEEAVGLGCDDRRCYLWAAVENGVVRPSDNAIRIESPAEATVAPASEPVTSHKETPVSTVKTDTAPPAEQPEAAPSTPKRRRVRTEAQAATNLSPIEQAKAIRVTLKQALAQNNEMIRALKRHERQARLVANTLDSLKQLKVA